MSLRYEKIDWQLSTVALHEIYEALKKHRVEPWGYSTNAVANSELCNVMSEIRSRLQRTDVDVQAEKNRRTTICTDCQASLFGQCDRHRAAGANADLIG